MKGGNLKGVGRGWERGLLMVGVFVRKWERGGGWALNAECWMLNVGDWGLQTADWVVTVMV